MRAEAKLRRPRSNQTRDRPAQWSEAKGNTRKAASEGREAGLREPAHPVPDIRTNYTLEYREIHPYIYICGRRAIRKLPQYRHMTYCC